MKIFTILKVGVVTMFVASAAFAQNNVLISSSASNGGSWDDSGNPAVWTANNTSIYSFPFHNVNKDEIVSRLNAGTSVTIYTPYGSIYLNDSVSIWKTSGGDATLKLLASTTTSSQSNIVIGYISNGGADTIASTSGKLSIIFNADGDGNSDGFIATNQASNSSNCYFASNGGDIVFGGGSDPYTTSAYGYPSGWRGVFLMGVHAYSSGGKIIARGTSTSSSYAGVELGRTTIFQSTTGDVTIVGSGGGNGVTMYTDSTKVMTDDGIISITGTGGSGVTPGFRMSDASRVLSSNGNITITGTGGTSPYGNGYGGVDISGYYTNAPLVQTANGIITVTGTGGTAASGSPYGVLLGQGGSILATGTGSISITGTGGSGYSNCNGVRFTPDQAGKPGVIQTNSGSISINATGGVATNGGSSGMSLYSYNTTCSISSTTGAITIVSTSMKGGHGIDMSGEGTNIFSGGDISITTDTTSSGYAGSGINTGFGSDIKTTGSGNLTITAVGALTGSSNYGIYLGSGGNSRIETEDGNLTINAYGGGNANNGSHGISLATNSVLYSRGGRVVINSTAGYGGYGVSMGSNTYIQADSGSLYLTTTGTGAGYGAGLYKSDGTGLLGNNYGDTCYIKATGSGTAPALDGYGGMTIGSSTFPGELILEAGASTSDHINLSAFTVRGLGNLMLKPTLASTTIGIAGGIGSFDLSTSDLNVIQNGFHNITIGRNDGTGTMDVNAYTFNDSLTLQSGSGAINFNGALSVGTNSLSIVSDGIVSQSAIVTASGLDLSGTGTFNLNTQNNVIGTLSGSGADIKLRDDAGISIGSLSGTEVSLTTDSAFTETGEFSVTRLTLGGNAAYSFADTVQKLTLSGTASLTLTGDFAADSLVMNGGNIDAASYTFSLGTNSISALSIYLSRTSGIVLGRFKRWYNVNNVADASLFPIGTSSNYRPATLLFTSQLFTNGTITAEFVSSNPGTNGLPLTDSDNGDVTAMLTDGFWRVTNGDGMVGSYYTLDLSANGFSGVTSYEDVKMLKRDDSGSPWTLAGAPAFGTGSNSSPVVHRNSLIGWGEFGIAQSSIPKPIFSGTPSSINFGVKAINTSTIDSVKVKNIGALPLNISSVVSDSASFVISQGDTTIAVGDSVLYYITFVPTSLGAKNGTLKFYHDAAGSPLTVSLSGSVMVEEPTTQASSITFSSVNDNSMKIRWTNGNGSNRLVLLKSGSAVNATPADTTTYNADSTFGSGSQIGSGNYVVFNGTADSVVVTGLTMSTNYYVSVFEFNGTSSGVNYLTTSPATATQTTTGPQYDTTAGYALSFDGVDDYVALPIAPSPSAYTIEMWVKPMTTNNMNIFVRTDAIGNQNGAFSHQLKIEGGTFVHYIYDEYWYGSIGISGTTTITANQWYHVAIVEGNGTAMQLYVNGVKEADMYDTYADYPYQVWTGGSVYLLGSDGGGLPYFQGMIDEVKIWNSVRSAQQIREDMHRTNPITPVNLLASYEFKEGSGTAANNTLGTYNGTIYNSASWITSTVPVGRATSASSAAFTSGTASLGTISLTTTDAFDAAVDLYATALSVAPNALPIGSSTALNDRYWIINTFGTPGTFSADLTFTVPSTFTNNGTASASNYTLYRRNSNDDGSWTSIATGASLTATSITFNGITSFSQFAIGTNDPLPVELVSVTATPKQNNVDLHWRTASELNSYGFEIQKTAISGQSSEKKWSKVGFVEGAGTINAPKEYSFTDKKAVNGKYEYRLKLVDRDGSFKYSQSVEAEVKYIPEVFALSQNYPNPFNPATTINYQLPKNSHVTLKVYDILGKEVLTVVDEMKEAGSYDVSFNASNLASGVYFYRIQARQTEGGSNKDFVQLKKMMLLK